MPSTRLLSRSSDVDYGGTKEKEKRVYRTTTSKFPVPPGRDAFVFSYGCVVFW